MSVVSVCECFDQLKMAEFALEEVFSNNLSISGNPTNLDCAVCLQTCIHPAELPCGHIFCYLCIKGIVNQGRRCAMCRHEIPVDYLDKPRLLKPMDAEITSQGFEDGHLWFYEGHNGWWQYDDRTSLELESAYQKGERCCELLIAGFLYIIDFDGMLQFRRNDPSRRRRIKRDIATTSKKGIAGLKTTKNCNSVLSNASENEPNETNQNSSGSNSLVLNNLGSLRNINGSINSAQQTEPILSHQRMAGRNISGYSFPACRTASAINSNRNFEEDNSTTNYNLGSTVQNTLDWAIEQIESLNLELINDYETIFRDYGHLESNLSQSRNRRTSSNHLNRCSIMSNSLNDSFENDLELPQGISEGSDSVNTIPSAPPLTSASRNSSISDNISEAEAQSVLVSPPQPPPRSRGMPRSRSRRDFVQRSSSLNCDKFFQRFVSKK